MDWCRSCWARLTAPCDVVDGARGRQAWDDLRPPWWCLRTPLRRCLPSRGSRTQASGARSLVWAVAPSPVAPRVLRLFQMAFAPITKRDGLPTPQPNMRLKLAGLSLLRESEWLCPVGHRTSSITRCADGAVARSLSAI